MSSAPLAAFVEKFHALTLERLVRLNQSFIQWHEDPEDPSGLRDMQRELHTLKGEAKLMNAGNVAEVVHRIEDHLAAAPPPGQQRSELDSAILAGFDLLGALVTQEGSDALTARWQAYVAKPVPGTEPVANVSPWSEDTGRLALRSAQVQSRRSRRVDMQKLDAVADITGDLLLTHGRLTQSIRKIQALLPQAEANMATCLDQARKWLTQQQTAIESLEATVRDLRLVPLRTLVDTFERTMQDLAYEQGKQVRLVQDNTGVGIDSDVLERLGDPILQLLCNGVVHGIEPASVRQKAGKAPQGVLQVAVRPGASVVDIDVSDDGAGVQLARVVEVAVQNQLVDASDAQLLADDALLELIFQPGFTTRNKVSDVAGRGVGLDAVRAQVGQLGGTVHVRSFRGSGTIFTISVPTTMLWVRALLVRWDQQYFAIPADAVAKVVRLEPQAKSKNTLLVRDTPVNMVGLGYMLGLPASGDEALVAVIVRHEKRACALRVHQVMGERQVVQRRLEPNHAHMPYHSGTATLENGSRAGLLNIPQLLDDLRHTKTPASRQPLVLVADDSELVRERVAAMLQRAGFRVTQANDGIAALRQVERERPDAILSDLEMPHLDGLGLLAAIRRQPDLQHLPLVIISAKETPELQAQARALGASGYFNKAAMQEAALNDLLRHLTLLDPGGV